MDEQEKIQQATAGLQLPHMPQQKSRRQRTRSQPQYSSSTRSHSRHYAPSLQTLRDDYYDDVDEEEESHHAFSGMHPARAQERYHTVSLEKRIPEAFSSDFDNDIVSTEKESPTIRILLVSDIDLASSSALAEFALLQNNKIFDASRIDICIACGPFCRDEDLMPYLKGKQRRQHQQQHEERKTQQTLPSTTSTSSSSWSSVFFRAPEETAALEGLLTAAISQLENIVCRVVFCPGSTDPITNTGGREGSGKNSDLRLTPNSRNIHQRWLPLAPGLGCAGLLFLDTPNGRPAAGIRIKAPRRRPMRQAHDDSDDEPDDEDDDYNGGHLYPEEPVTLTNVYGNKRMGAENYCHTLERLLKLAPPSQEQHKNVVTLNRRMAQTILVTHYFQPPPPTKETQEKRYIDNFSDGYNLNDESEVENLTTYISSGSDGIDEVVSDFEDSNKDPSPWPAEEHKNFVESDIAQDQLALEIASGCSATHAPKCIKIGNVHLVIPGSLRERGEFCLIDISLTEGSKEPATATKTTTKAGRTSPNASAAAQFAWKVAHVEFHNMNRLP